MKSFVLLTNLKIGIIFSENQNDLDIILSDCWYDEFGNYDIDCVTCNTIRYNEVLVKSNNLCELRNIVDLIVKVNFEYYIGKSI